VPGWFVTFCPPAGILPKKGLMKSLDFLSKIPIIIFLGYAHLSGGKVVGENAK
jgi:hypothetical protein